VWRVSRPRRPRETDRAERLKQEVERLRRALAERERQLTEQAKTITEKEKRIADLERQLALRQQNSTTTSKPTGSAQICALDRHVSSRTDLRE
jgi:septal ring factor EnvC (AmiA/AmiB activator)